LNPTSFAREIFHKALETFHLYNLYAEMRFNYHRDKIIKITKSPKQDLVDLEYIKMDSKSLLIVVPSFYSKNWIPAEGNFYFEMFQSAKEKYPNWEIEVYFCEAEREWQKTLEEVLIKIRPDILLISSEIDPNGNSDWTLDVFIGNLKRVWNGTICYLLFDSAFPLHVWRLKRLIRINPKNFVVSIDRNLRQEEKINSTNIGPTFLPISKLSMKILSELIQRKIAEEDLDPIQMSFIGQEYPYRRKILSEIATGFHGIQINPQLQMKNPHSYLSYITALYLSEFTINMSRQHVINKPQLKCRVLEASLFGSYVISDESVYTQLFLEADEHFSYSNLNSTSAKALHGHLAEKNVNRESIRIRAEKANIFFF
jgi:hypothetical protein